MGCVSGRIRVEYKELQKLQLCCDEYAIDVDMRDQREPAESCFSGLCGVVSGDPSNHWIQKITTTCHETRPTLADTDMVPWCLHCNIEMVSMTAIQSVPVFNGIRLYLV